MDLRKEEFERMDYASLNENTLDETNTTHEKCEGKKLITNF